jgi:ABC-2 type transport system permease protein
MFDVTAAALPRSGFRAAVRFEWTKMTTARSTLWTLATLGVLIPVLAVFVAATGSLQPDDTILGASLTGTVGSLVVAAASGAIVMTGEHSTGTMRTTLAACPRRSTVMAAKAIVVAGTMFVVSLAASTAAYLIGSAMLSGDDYASGDPWPALLGIALGFSAVGVLGLAVGTALRHSAGAVSAVVGVILVPSLFGPLFGDWQRWVGGASPTAALEKLSQTSDATVEAVGTLGGWPSLVVLIAYTLVAVVGSARLFATRDT